jgi:hypothetical protein
MASATGIPEANPGLSEQEPLLGRVGDASQQDGKPLYHNFIIGTGIVAQAGIWILAALVWSGVFSNDLIFFSPHPLLNSAALLLSAQALLVLQPTHTAQQKKEGTWVHAGLNDLGLVAFIAAFIIIEVNKARSGLPHFESVHSILGLATYVLLLVQATVGFTAYFTPQLYGGVGKAKSLYKYHRWSGYVVFTLGLATVCAATQTTYNKNILHIQLWAVVVASVLTLAGLLPRIRKAKLGL